MRVARAAPTEHHDAAVPPPTPHRAATASDALFSPSLAGEGLEPGPSGPPGHLAGGPHEDRLCQPEDLTRLPEHVEQSPVRRSGEHGREWGTLLPPGKGRHPARQLGGPGGEPRWGA